MPDIVVVDKRGNEFEPTGEERRPEDGEYFLCNGEMLYGGSPPDKFPIYRLIKEGELQVCCPFYVFKKRGGCLYYCNAFTKEVYARIFIKKQADPDICRIINLETQIRDAFTNQTNRGETE